MNASHGIGDSELLPIVVDRRYRWRIATDASMVPQTDRFSYQDGDGKDRNGNAVLENSEGPAREILVRDDDSCDPEDCER